ncbi:hypothetical protein [Sediminispirochaeta bajacaliforniensis]|uniref:hypothetical protein n=1 Tax=Sediminispirochaeta bajacaliforniensis TaxID=148 RepID=UPI0003704C47|nr:hypothetical protein [Sediminispirochaeta bajacaliforniensis]
MSKKEFSVATFNLYNLNEPGKPMYNTEGWSEEDYHSKNRIWLFQELIVFNDHLNSEDHKHDGTNDHGILKATF